MLPYLETQTKNPRWVVGEIGKPCTGGFVFPAYHKMGRFCNYKPLGFNFCDVDLCRTFMDISNLVWIWLEFLQQIGTLVLRGTRGTKETCCQEFNTMLQLFLCGKVTKSDSLSESRVPSRRKLGTAAV